MALVCIHCSLKAMLQGDEPPLFEESVIEHMRLFHPDPLATARERNDLEHKLSAMMRRSSGIFRTEHKPKG